MREYQLVCDSCDTEYNIAIMDEDADIRYCPVCGYEIVEELDFGD